VVAVGFGVTCDVFLAWSTAHGKFVAIKQFRSFLFRDVQFVERTGFEGLLWSQFRHPNILRLLGFIFDTSPIPSYVSEYMGNGNVAEYFKYHPGHPDASEMCKIVHGISSGLDYMHVRQLSIHADLKSANILVSDDGKPLLIDFGLSVSLSASHEVMQGEDIAGWGSLRWMAKERLSIDQSLSVKSDIWSLGMVIYELLSQDVPYHHVQNDMRVHLAILDGELPIVPDFTRFDNSSAFHAQYLWNIALKCWNDNPENRPSAGDVMAGLKLFI